MPYGRVDGKETGRPVSKLIKEDRYYIVIEIKWDDKFVRRGESGKTKETLKISDWNPETHVNRSWRQDLHHMVKTAESG